MSKEAYFEMCEMLGSEPVESEIPVEISDFPNEVQLSFTIYGMLSDIWDPMGGSYLGKDYANLFDFFSLYEIENKQEQLFYLSVIKQIDQSRSEVIAEKQRIRQQQQSAKAR